MLRLVDIAAFFESIRQEEYLPLCLHPHRPRREDWLPFADWLWSALCPVAQRTERRCPLLAGRGRDPRTDGAQQSVSAIGRCRADDWPPLPATRAKWGSKRPFDSPNCDRFSAKLPEFAPNKGFKHRNWPHFNPKRLRKQTYQFQHGLLCGGTLIGLYFLCNQYVAISMA